MDEWIVTLGVTPQSSVTGHVVVPCLPRTGSGSDGGQVCHEWRTLCAGQPAVSVLSGCDRPVVWCLDCMGINDRLDLELRLATPLG